MNETTLNVIYAILVSSFITWSVTMYSLDRLSKRASRRGSIELKQYYRQQTAQKNLAGRITNVLIKSALKNTKNRVEINNSGRDPNGSYYILIGYDNGNFDTVYMMRVFLTSGLEIMSRSSAWMGAPKWENTPATEENILLFLAKAGKYIEEFGSSKA